MAQSSRLLTTRRISYMDTLNISFCFGPQRQAEANSIQVKRLKPCLIKY